MAEPLPEHRLAVRVRGRVQGVGYRAFIRKHARQLRLAGWVRNEEDGTVRLIAEGTQDSLQVLKRHCHEGPPFSRVDQVEVIWEDATGEFPGFDLRL